MVVDLGAEGMPSTCTQVFSPSPHGISFLTTVPQGKDSYPHCIDEEIGSRRTSDSAKITLLVVWCFLDCTCFLCPTLEHIPCYICSRNIAGGGGGGADKPL